MGLASKLVDIQKEIGFIEFDGHNPVYGKKGGKAANYASAAGVIRKLNTALSERGVLALAKESIEHVAQDGALVFVSCEITWTDAETGETLVSRGVGSGADRGDKAAMKASTAAYKYAIAHGLALAWGAEDPEEPRNSAAAEEATGASKGRKKASKRPSSRRTKSSGPSTEDIVQLIKDANVADALEKEVKPLVVATRGTKDYSKLKELFMLRRSELGGE